MQPEAGSHELSHAVATAHGDRFATEVDEQDLELVAIAAVDQAGRRLPLYVGLAIFFLAPLAIIFIVSLADREPEVMATTRPHPLSATSGTSFRSTSIAPCSCCS